MTARVYTVALITALLVAAPVALATGNQSDANTTDERSPPPDANNTHDSNESVSSDDGSSGNGSQARNGGYGDNREPYTSGEREFDEDASERPDDAAWTEDCPPDMACAMDTGSQGEDHEPCEDCPKSHSGLPEDDAPPMAQSGAADDGGQRNDAPFVGVLVALASIGLVAIGLTLGPRD